MVGAAKHGWWGKFRLRVGSGAVGRPKTKRFAKTLTQINEDYRKKWNGRRTSLTCTPGRGGDGRVGQSRGIEEVEGRRGITYKEPHLKRTNKAQDTITEPKSAWTGNISQGRIQLARGARRNTSDKGNAWPGGCGGWKSDTTPIHHASGQPRAA